MNNVNNESPWTFDKHKKKFTIPKLLTLQDLFDTEKGYLVCGTLMLRIYIQLTNLQDILCLNAMDGRAGSVPVSIAANRERSGGVSTSVKRERSGGVKPEAVKIEGSVGTTAGTTAIDGRAGTTAVKIEGSAVVSAKRERSGGVKQETVKPKLREGDLGVDADASGQTEKLESICAIPVYNDKSHEELRWEHYQLCSSAPTNAQSGSEFGQNTSPFGQTAGFRPSNFFSSASSNHSLLIESDLVGVGVDDTAEKERIDDDAAPTTSASLLMGSDPKEKDSHGLANPPVSKESDFDIFLAKYITDENHAEVLKQVFQTQPSAFESLLTTTTMTTYKKTFILSCLADLVLVLKMTKWSDFHGDIKGRIQMLWTEIIDGAPDLCEWLQPLRKKMIEATTLTDKTGELKKKLQEVEDQLKKINVDSDSMMGLGFF